MAKMTKRMKELFEKVEIVALGTSTSDGAPNTVPVGSKKIIDDETVLISKSISQQDLGQHEIESKGIRSILGRSGRLSTEGHCQH